MSAQCGVGSCDAESGLATYCGGLHIQLPRKLFSRTQTTPYLSSVVPAPRSPPLWEIVQGRIGFCLKRTCVPSGIQFTRHFIKLLVVETKQIVSSDSNVILTRKTCGQRSGMAVGGKRRALALYFSGAHGKWTLAL